MVSRTIKLDDVHDAFRVMETGQVIPDERRQGRRAELLGLLELHHSHRAGPSLSPSAGVFERQGETGRPSLAAVTPALCGSHSVIFFHS